MAISHNPAFHLTTGEHPMTPRFCWKQQQQNIQLPHPHNLYCHRGLREQRPADSTSDTHSMTETSSPFIVRQSPFPRGTLLLAVRSLSRRGRFPTNGHYLPLSMTNDLTHFVNFRVETRDSGKSNNKSSSLLPSHHQHRVETTMLCYKTKMDPNPTFEIPLAGAMMVSKTCSGNGPCLYLTSSAGTFEFQCQRSGQHDYNFWESQMRHLGVRIIFPQDLFSTTSNDPVGEGSFAQVYSATHKVTGKKVVIKRVPKERLSNLPENHPSAVHIEIDVLRRLCHPYIVEFQTAFEDDIHYFIVLERLMGGNVYEWLRVHRSYNEQQAKGTMFRVLAALVALEQENVVHRDLKLENLVLENPNDPTSVKLIDFGLAAFLNTPRMSMHCGSPGFVAPEIIAKQPYGCRADMFSAGVFLYSILCGKFPFHSDGDTATKTLAKNERCNVSFDAPQWKNVSSDAKDLIGRLLTKDPSVRLSAVQAMNHKWMTGRISCSTLPYCHTTAYNYNINHQTYQRSRYSPQFPRNFCFNESCRPPPPPSKLGPSQTPCNSNSNIATSPCCNPIMGSPLNPWVSSNLLRYYATVTRLALICTPPNVTSNYRDNDDESSSLETTFSASKDPIMPNGVPFHQQHIITKEDNCELPTSLRETNHSMVRNGGDDNAADSPSTPHSVDPVWSHSYSSGSRSTSVSCCCRSCCPSEQRSGSHCTFSHIYLLNTSTSRWYVSCSPSDHRRLSNEVLLEQSL